VTTKTLASWLSKIQQSETFLTPKLSQISDQTLILDRSVVVNRLALAVRKGQNIVAFGDYDCDGITACVLITQGIRSLGGRVTPMLASRYSGGYGFSDPACDKVLALKPSVLVTLDCGSSDHDRLARIKAAGIDALVIDHHLVPDKPLPATAFLNPHRPGCNSQYKWYASVGLAWSVIGGLKKELDIDLEMRQFLDLVAIGTIGDVAPLTLDNRALVRAGLDVVSKAERPGLRTLLSLAKIVPGTPFSGRDIAFRISPQINAPGRLQDPDIVAHLLLASSQNEANALGETVSELTVKRRALTEEITEACLAQVSDLGLDGMSALVVGDPSWNHGIVGIVASRLVDRFHKPVCVIGHEGRGSLRGPPGVQLYEALKFCQAQLIKWGGHNAAAGCQLSFDNLSDFRETFCRYFSESEGNSSPVEQESNLLPLNSRDQLMQVCEDLQLLEPCGQGNIRPVLQVSGTVESAKEVKGGHLKLDVRLGPGRTLGCFAIAKGSMEPLLRPGVKVNLTGDLRKNIWRGRETAEMFVESLDIVSG
jgi:single-stranded-DNA-specific exonuclease